MNGDTNTLKIMVDFKNKKLVGTYSHRGSKEFKDLLNKGYEEAGTVRQTPELKIWVTGDYFDPNAKYPKDSNNIETIQA